MKNKITKLLIEIAASLILGLLYTAFVICVLSPFAALIAAAYWLFTH